MRFPPGVSPTLLFLKFLFLELTYHVSCVYVGVKIFIDLSVETSLDRHFARDLRSTFHGEFRDAIGPEAIDRAMYICAANRRSELLFSEGRSLASFILKPMHRNLRENREMIEEAVRAWREYSASKEAGSLADDSGCSS